MRARFKFNEGLCSEFERQYDGQIFEVGKVFDEWKDNDKLMKCCCEGVNLFIWESCLEYLTEG